MLPETVLAIVVIQVYFRARCSFDVKEERGTKGRVCGKHEHAGMTKATVPVVRSTK